MANFLHQKTIDISVHCKTFSHWLGFWSLFVCLCNLYICPSSKQEILCGVQQWTKIMSNHSINSNILLLLHLAEKHQQLNQTGFYGDLSPVSDFLIHDSHVSFQSSQHFPELDLNYWYIVFNNIVIIALKIGRVC